MGPSCFFAAKEVFVTGEILVPGIDGVGEGRVEPMGVTFGFQVLPPLKTRNDTNQLGTYFWVKPYLLLIISYFICSKFSNFLHYDQ